jgi:predicted ribosome quality control (RQC) complex YloA/Tae2 family protein
MTMDQFLLHAVISESARRLVEHEILRVSSLGRCRYVLRFATPSRDNLLLSARPDLPRLHLLGARRVDEEPADRFAASLDQELAGAVLASLTKRPWDRVVEMRFRLPRRQDGEVERCLVFELLGRSTNLFLLDARGVLLGCCRDLRSESRALAVGARYEPPPGRQTLAAIPVGPEAIESARDCFGGARGFLEKVSPLFARDLEAAGADSAADERRLATLLEAIRSDAWSPVVYSPRPLQDMSEGESPGRNDLLVSPLPLLAPPVSGDDRGTPLASTTFDSPSAACEAGLGLLERLRDFKDLRDHHEALVRKEIERLATLSGKLDVELEKARASDRYRRLGEALLAGLSGAKVENDTALVPDPYDASGALMSIPIDPALSLPENARVLFERYKKGKRGVTTIERRLQAVRERLREWRALSGPAAATRAPADLDRLRDGMARLGLVHAPRPAKSPRAMRPQEEPTRVRRYTSAEGLTILVGKSGQENDTLTFRVASPWDFWLHAADRPGAHVIVRNPQRLKSLPERTLKLAADIAAYHSGARQESRVDVHYTQRKHVHKKKGMPSGQVLLRRFRTVQATPRIPTSSLEDV